MISRKSTRLLAYFIYIAFSDALENNVWAGERFDFERLKAFLYDNEYDANFIRKIERHYYNNRQVDEFIQGLHTGDSISAKTEEEAKERGQEFLLRLTKDVLPLVVQLSEEEVSAFNTNRQQIKETAKIFLAQLELDGYVYRNEKLYPAESAVIDVETEQSYLETLVDSLRLSEPNTIKHHIRQAEEDYREGRWGNSIGNSRSFLDAILAQSLQGVSNKLGLNLDRALYKNAKDVRLHLERQGLISPDEGATLGRIHGLLSNTGGHAYIAQKDQARLMWHLALTCSQFVLLRYEGFLKAHP